VKTLIIYNQTTEPLKFYAVEPESEAAVAARKVAGVYMNSDKTTKRQDAAFEELYEWFGSKGGKAARIQEHRITGKFSEVIAFGFVD